MIVAGGALSYLEATDTLLRLVERTNSPVGETQTGKGSIRYDQPCTLGAAGATRTLATLRAPRACRVPENRFIYSHIPRLRATSRARTIAPALLRVSSYSREGTESATTPPPAWK